MAKFPRHCNAQPKRLDADTPDGVDRIEVSRPQVLLHKLSELCHRVHLLSALSGPRMLAGNGRTVCFLRVQAILTRQPLIRTG